MHTFSNIIIYIAEILSRSTSVKDALKALEAGTELWKVRNKGGIRGCRWYKRKYRLDLPHLEIKYAPHKGSSKNVAATNCAKGEKITLLYFYQFSKKPLIS